MVVMVEMRVLDCGVMIVEILVELKHCRIG